jgi:hypothetical protein
MPSLFERSYRFTNDTTLDPLELNARFRSLDERIAQLEADKASLEATIAELRGEGVTRLTLALQNELPDILEDANTGYLTGLADGSVSWAKLDLSGASPGAIGAEVAGAVATHEATPGVHSISDVADLASTLAAKQNYSALLTAIAEETPSDLGLVMGTGTTYQVEVLQAGDSIAFVRENGTLRINATGSASGESNNGLNLGTGSGLYVNKVGTDLRFRSLVSGDASLSITEGADTVSIGFDSSALNLEISQVTNLQTTLDSKQGAHANLTSVAGLTPSDDYLVLGTGTDFEMAQLIGGNNVTVTHGIGAITIDAETGTLTFQNMGTGAGGIGLYSRINNDVVELRSVRSLNTALTVAQQSTTVDFDINPDTLAENISAGGITWEQVDKTGAGPGDVGAESAGAVVTHESGTAVHSIGAVSNLQTSLDARLTRVAASAQEVSTSIFVSEQTLSGGSPTPNAGTANYFYLRLTQNTTIQNPSNIPAGTQVLTFVLQQDATGNRTLAWGSNYFWGDDNTPPAMPTGANQILIVSFLQMWGYCYFLGAINHS